MAYASSWRRRPSYIGSKRKRYAAGASYRRKAYPTRIRRFKRSGKALLPNRGIIDDADLMENLTPKTPITTHPLLPSLNNGTNGGSCRDLDVIKLVGVQYHLTIHVVESHKNNEMITGEVIWLQQYNNKTPGNQPMFTDIFEHYLDNTDKAKGDRLNTDKYSYVGSFIKATELRHYKVLKKHRFTYQPNFMEAEVLRPGTRDGVTYPATQTLIQLQGKNRLHINGYLNFRKRKPTYVRFIPGEATGTWAAIKTNGLLCCVIINGHAATKSEVLCRYRIHYYY